jgi:succinate dehydrogenase / fumarate reductase iron-sulfur subunit
MRLRVFRWDPRREPGPRYQVYEVEDVPGRTVLSALLEVQGRQDPSLALRYSCRGAVCGNCGMLINKVPRLACRTQLLDVLGEGPSGPSKLRPFAPLSAVPDGWDRASEVLVEPLPNLDVVRDLVVDMEPFFEAYRVVEPWLVPEGAPPEGRERAMAQEQVARLEALVGCILCGICTSSCPVVGTDEEFLGPAALAKAWRFHEDARDVRLSAIVEMLDTPDGIRACELVFNCVRACPKGVAPGGAIRAMKKEAERLGTGRE